MKSGVRLDLPLAACPYVIVLVNVPELKANQQESTEQLIHKAQHWLFNRTGDNFNLNKHIIVARRVNWVGRAPKTLKGDCIIINFVNHYMVGDLLSMLPSTQTLYSEIYALPLGFFFFFTNRPLNLKFHSTK